MPDMEATPSLTELFPAVEDGTPDRADRKAVVENIRDATVLLTGAGGSLGCALARRLVALPVGRLLCLDSSEQGLVQLRDRLGAGERGPQAVRGRNGAPAWPEVEYLLADLRLATDRSRALRPDPDVVVHAAAYKHVPFLEERPVAAVQNNLLATANWLGACRHHASVRRFVLVSTDKAVRPTGVMGRTKAAAERLMRALRAGTAPGLTAVTVRLCNVFGSRGSVVPRFGRRLRAGEPLPVTHPDMERWFVTAAEAARAVLEALGRAPGTYVPTMGRRVRIDALARRLVRWHRPDGDPEAWIRYVGLRAGERLREMLLAPEERPGTPVEGGLRRAAARTPTRSVEALRRALDRLRRDCRAGRAAAVRTHLRCVGEPSAAESAPPGSTDEGTVDDDPVDPA
ncbi:MAG: polysaccharide biosynthesis protein [Salinibacter sp.]